MGSFIENINLENLLNKIEDLMNNDNDFKANFSKVRKRKSEKEEKLFIYKFNQILKSLIEYKDGRSMVHIFHLRFIFTNIHTKRARIHKLTAIINEYIRLSNKSFNDHHHVSGILTSSPTTNTTTSTNTIYSNNSPNFSLSSSSPNIITVPSLAIDDNNNNNNIDSPTITTPPPQQENNNKSHNFGSSVSFTPLSKLNEQITTYNNNNQHDDVEIININNTTTTTTLNVFDKAQSNTSTPLYHSPGSQTPIFFSNSSSPLIYVSSPSIPLSPVLNSSNSSSNNKPPPQQQQQIIIDSNSSQEIKIAKELLNYLITHEIDIDNSLVGCDVNPMFMDSVFKHRSQNSFSKRSLIKIIKSWATLKDDHLIKEVRKTSNSFNNLDFKKGELIIIECQEQTLNNGGNGNTGNHDQNDEFDFSDDSGAQPSSNLNVHHGGHDSNFNDEISNRSGSYIFARFEEEFNKTCKVYIIPTEDSKQLLSISVNNVYKLSIEIIEAIKNEKFMELVSDPSKPFFNMLTFKEKQLFNEYLEKKDMDTSILDKCKNNSASIIDLPTLKHSIAIIGELDKNISSSTLLTDVIKLAKSESKPFLEAARKTCFYIPMYVKMEEIIKNIENIRETELRSTVQTAFISLDTFFYRVHLEKKEILDSTAKGKLSQWWSALIKEQLNVFLTNIGFDNTAVPDDYLDKPPQNYQSVKQNMLILHQLLEVSTLIYIPTTSSSVRNNSNNTTEQQLEQLQLIDGTSETISQKEFKKLVIRLAETIYPMIDEFVLKSYLVILDSFDMYTCKHLSELEDKGYLSLEFVKSLVAQKKETLEKSKSQQLENLLKDIQYCIEMKNLENVSQEKRLDIVTITGLVFGRVHRLENETRTVVENWKHLDINNNNNSGNNGNNGNGGSGNSFNSGNVGGSGGGNGSISIGSKRAISSSDSGKWSFSNSEQAAKSGPSKFLLSQRKSNSSSSSVINQSIYNSNNNSHNNSSNSSSASTSPSSNDKSLSNVESVDFEK